MKGECKGLYSLETFLWVVSLKNILVPPTPRKQRSPINIDQNAVDTFPKPLWYRVQSFIIIFQIKKWRQIEIKLFALQSEFNPIYFAFCFRKRLPKEEKR